MTTVIALNNGKSETVFDVNKMLQLVAEKFSYDIAKEIREHIEILQEEYSELEKEYQEMEDDIETYREDAEVAYKTLKKEGDSLGDIIDYYLDEKELGETYTKLQEVRENINDVVCNSGY